NSARITCFCAQKLKSRHPCGPRDFNKDARQRPTLPSGYPDSTIGAGGLNYRVRNGNGCLPSAMVTELGNYTGYSRTSGLTARATAITAKPSAKTPTTTRQ